MSRKHCLMQLIHLHETLDHLSDCDFLKWIEHLVSINQKPLVISAIFRELYLQAKIINTDTLDDIIQTATLLLSQSTTDNAKNINETTESIKLNQNSDCKIKIRTNLINNIPETILSRIATYLTTKELFFNWNNACKQLLRIGMKPESIHHWHLTQSHIVHLSRSKSQLQTQFDIYSFLSQLKMITFHDISRDPVLKHFPKTTSRNWELIDVDRCWSKPEDLWDSIHNVRKLILRDSLSIAGECVDIERHRQKLRQVAFVGGGICVQTNDCLQGHQFEEQRESMIDNERKIVKVLQAIIPLSEKDHEIECRILEEKIKIFNENPNLVDRDSLVYGDDSVFVTPYLTDKQIEKITNDVRNEIEVKYDKNKNTLNHDYDCADELCYYDENDKKIEESICNPIEMLEFDNCESRLNENEYEFVWSNYLQNGHSRTVHGLSNLKSFAFCGNDCPSVNINYGSNTYGRNDGNGLLTMVTQLILNSIGNKLQSLHICSCSVIWNGMLHFFSKIRETLILNHVFDEKWLKKYENESWYLKNVSELCLKIEHDVWNELLHGISPLINSYTFPNLKNLKIICFLKSSNFRPRDKSQMMFNYNYNQNGINPTVPFILVSLMTQRKHLESLDLCFVKRTLEDFFVVEKPKDKEEESNNDPSNPIGLYLRGLKLYLMTAIQAKTSGAGADIISNNSKKFILKLHFKITIPTYNRYSFSKYDDHEDNCIKIIANQNIMHLALICDEVIKFSQWICNSFENTMFGFKITFNADQNNWKRWDLIVNKFELLCNTVCDNPFFKSMYCNINATDTADTNELTAQVSTFQASMKEYIKPNDEHEVVFAMIVNKCGNGTSGNINGYCEPRFKYQCQYCATEKWLESKLSDEYGCKTIIHRVIE